MEGIIEDAANADHVLFYADNPDHGNTFFTPQHVVGLPVTQHLTSTTALSVTYNELRASMLQQVTDVTYAVP